MTMIIMSCIITVLLLLVVVVVAAAKSWPESKSKRGAEAGIGRPNLGERLPRPRSAGDSELRLRLDSASGSLQLRHVMSRHVTSCHGMA